MSLRTLIAVFSFIAIAHSRSVRNVQNLSDSPDCTCLTRTEETIGGVVKGLYSYVDPVGSLIEVTYSMNPDKTDYKEERKVIKGYINSKEQGGLTVEEVVKRVMEDLTPTVIQVVRTTVQGSSQFDLSSESSRSQIVVQILNKLRPVVFQIVTEVLQITSTTYLDAGELTDTIMIKLTPIIKQGVNEESDIVLGQQLGQQKANFVLTITNELKPTIISIIKAAVASSDLTNLDGLLEAILRQLRPIVLRACQAGLAGTNLNIDATEMADEIMINIRPFVTAALEQEVQTATTLTEDQVVQIIITDLKPTVIQVIQTTVASAKVDLGDLDQLLKTILRQMRPVVLIAAQNALKTSPVAGDINANSLTDKVILEMTAFVRQAIQQEVKGQVENLENKVVRQVTTELRPTVIKVVQATVSSTTSDTSDTSKLLETILVQLNPVVLNEVRNALKTSTYPLNAQSLTVRIVKELRPFVSEALKKELAEKERNAAQEVISEVTAELEPSVIKVIESVVGASGVDLNNPQSLVELIIAQLRPVVFQTVIKALKSSPYQNIDPQKLTVRIIIELTPFVETGVQNQVEVVKEQNNGLITELVDQLGPAIKNTILGLEGNAISKDLADEIVRVTPPKVAPLIPGKVSTLMKQPGSSSLPDSALVDRVIAGMQGDVIAAIEAVEKYKVVLNKPGFGSIVQRIMAKLRALIQRGLDLYREANRPKPTPKPVPVQTDLTNIFGTGGSYIKKDSPDSSYEHNVGK